MRSEDRETGSADGADLAAAIGETPVSPVLGRLYLEQGYLEEAERVFLTVLEAHPGDRAALEGLDAVRARRSDSSGGGATHDSGSIDSGTDRPAAARAETIARLESFLSRLRHADSRGME